jgi:hypothetical protein
MGHLSRSLLLVFAGSLTASAANNSGLGIAKAAMSQLPLRFEENRGQWDPSVRYTARAGGYNLRLTDHGVALPLDGKAVRIDLVHSSSAPVIEPLDRMVTATNYLVGNRQNWHTGIANYSRLRYHDIYPGVDIIYYGTRNQVEFDFLLAPGASPDAIRFDISGADQVRLNSQGDLAITAGGAEVLQKLPAIYQDGRRIAGHYTLLADNQAGLVVDSYDRARPLVIDPIITYSSYLGGSGQDQITAIKMAPSGLLYVTGFTNTGDMPALSGAFQLQNNGNTDCFFAVMDSHQNFALTVFTYLGGSNNDQALALDVDAAGFAYITGFTDSTDFPLVGDSFQTTGGTTQDAFIAILDPHFSNLTYSTFLGGATDLESGNGIAVGPNGWIYVVGTTRSTDFPVTDSAYAPVLYGTQDAFITVLDPTSTNLVYSTYLGGELTDDGRAIALDSKGKVYVAITTNSTQFPLEGPGYRQNLQGLLDVALAVLDITQSGEPSVTYTTYLGGSDLDEVRALALDANNNVILTGYTFSTDFPITSGTAIQRNMAGNGDAFISVVNPSDPTHFLVYSTYFGGSQGEVAYDVKPDASGNIFFTGYTLSPDLFTVNAPQPGTGGGIQFFAASINPRIPGKQGIVFCTYLGATGTYVGRNITIGADGTIYVAGYGQNGLPANNGYNGGQSDGYLVAFK